MNTMTTPTKESLADLLAAHTRPCVSLYQATHRHHPENHQDPIRFRNLVKELQATLLETLSAAESSSLLEPFHALANDDEFWNGTLDSLAVFAAPDFFQVFCLPRPVTESVFVGDRFHVTPLRQFLQSVERYQLLALSLDSVRLFEGDRDTIEEIELAAEVPRTIIDALGAKLTDSHQTVASYGGVGGAHNAMFHGKGAKADEADIDAERFFRAVDQAIIAHHSSPGLPLLLAALPEHHHRFQALSQNPRLLLNGITVNPDAMTNDSLRTLAWQVVEPEYEMRLRERKNDFEQARASGRGSDSLPEITDAVASGRIATLFLMADRQLVARLDEEAAQVDDALEILGALVDKKGGEVLVLPATQMPTQAGVAAIYRY